MMQKNTRSNGGYSVKQRAAFFCSVAGIDRFIATTETTKYRVFQFLSGDMLIDHMIVGVALDDPYHLGVLSSEAHRVWTYANCGMMGVASIDQGHRYTKTQIFDTFPFPEASQVHRAAISELAEELDATRKVALAETPDLTITEIYNLRAQLRGGSASADERNRALAARAGIVDRLHEQIDAEVAAAYGWGWPLSPKEIVAHLVALNAARAEEEAADDVRWLRPDYQAARFGKRGKSEEDSDAE